MKPAVLLTLMRGADKLAAALLERADVEIITMYDSTLDALRQRGIPYTRLLDFLTPPQQSWAVAEAGRRLGEIREILRRDEARAGFRDVVPDGGDWDILCARVERTLDQRLYSEMALAEAIRRCASERDLRLLVVQQDISNDMRVAIGMGRRLGVPTLHTPHGVPGGAVIPITLCGGIAADYIAVFSEHCREIYESLHTPPERIFVTGNFEWDIFSKPPPPHFRGDLCKGMNLAADQPILVWALSYPHTFTSVSARYTDYVERTTEAVLDAFGKLSETHPEWQFILRPHPSDVNAPKDLAERAKAHGIEKVRVDPYTSSVGCTAMADLIICCQSNLGIEAIIAGKPVINCVIEEFGQGVYDEGIGRVYLEEDAVINVHTVEDLLPGIEAALTDPGTQRDFLAKRSATIRRFNGVNDGKATERLCDVILRLVQQSTAMTPPLDRFPDTERMLAQAVPEDAGLVLVAGRGSEFTADAVREVRPNATVESVYSLEETQTLYDAVVLSEPVPHSCEADALLRKARALLVEGGSVAAVFQHGGNRDAEVALRRGAWAPAREGFEAASSWGQYARPGVDLVLSRCELVCEQSEPLLCAGQDNAVCGDGVVDGWVVRARPRVLGPGAPGIRKQERVARANEANARGERSFAEGDYLSATAAFAEAIKEYGQEALFFNNLAIALHALGETEKAWRRLLEALHLNPFQQSARANLRAVAGVLGRSVEAERILGLFGDDGRQEP